MAFQTNEKMQRIAYFSLLSVCVLLLTIKSVINSQYSNQPTKKLVFTPIMGIPIEKQDTTLKLHRFNPNNVSKVELEKMGIPSLIASNIIKYREKGGTFSKPEDVRKMYGLGAGLYDRLKPFISIPQKVKKKVLVKNKKKVLPKAPAVLKKEPICLNQASDSLLQSVRGIGPYFAKKIVQFREKTGGFYSISQLIKLPRMDSTKLALMKSGLKICVKPTKVALIDSVSFKKINALIGYEQTKKFFAYLRQHSPIATRQQLVDIVWITPAEIRVLEHYFILK